MFLEFSDLTLSERVKFGLIDMVVDYINARIRPVNSPFFMSFCNEAWRFPNR